MLGEDSFKSWGQAGSLLGASTPAAAAAVLPQVQSQLTNAFTFKTRFLTTVGRQLAAAAAEVPGDRRESLRLCRRGRRPKPSQAAQAPATPPTSPGDV